jgi:hypothetical protein
MNDQTPISIRYQFVFAEGKTIDFLIRLHPETLEYLHREDRQLPEWTRFTYLQCDDCSKKNTDETHCPVAANISDVVEAFRDVYSYDVADVLVTTAERVYARTQIAVQKALSSLLGIIMVTSGCENLDKLRPMVRFHLPFASIDETIFRSVSVYLLAQYFRVRKGLEPDWEVNDLAAIYSKIAKINANTVKRLQIATKKDAGLNAVAILDAYAQMTPLSIEETLKDFEYIFKPYLETD